MRSLRLILALSGKALLVRWRTPGILLAVFVPGIVMYSVFTMIFAGPAAIARPFRAAVIDQDDSPASRALIDALKRSNVVVVRTVDESPEGAPLTVETARRHIRRKGKFRVAIVIPDGYGDAPTTLAGERHGGVRLIFDETQPMEADAISALVQLAAGRALFAQTFERMQSTTAPSGEAEEPRLVHIERSGVSIRRMEIASKHTFLAGIVPMFVLFGSLTAARGLLEDVQSGEMARIRAAPVSSHHVVSAGALSGLLFGVLQCYSMYLFAWLVFDVAIWEIAGGLLALTLATCAAASGFGLLLGALCRNTQNLDTVGTIVILASSAIGGSMVPRFIMQPFMQKLGLLTINGWAYDGFIALVRAEGWAGIRTACLVLVAIAVGCVLAGGVVFGRMLRTVAAR